MLLTLLTRRHCQGVPLVTEASRKEANKWDRHDVSISSANHTYCALQTLLQPLQDLSDYQWVKQQQVCVCSS